MMNKSFLAFIFLFIAALLFNSCGTIGQGYHNLTAHYNAYFMAEEKMMLAEQSVRDGHKDDYNRIIDILPEMDPVSAKGISGDMEYVIKKASIPVQLHKSSNWTDNSLNLIGKARFYKEEYEKAASTFKYVNTKGKGQDEKHEALIWLMRTFLREKDYDQSEEVFRYIINKERKNLNDVNKREFFLTRAEYEIKIEKDYDKAVRYLEVAIPYAKNKDRKGRMHFVAGQLYQILGQDNKAHDHYQAVLKNNPTYERSFYAKLYRAQVSTLAEGKDLKRIRKYFAKMLKDKKNVEYRGKIYYEMALFELKRGDEETARKYLKTSIKESGDPIQKSYAYIKLGELDYSGREYVSAKYYYDSTVQTMSKEWENYDTIVKRQRILTDFVEQYLIVKREDSLQQLSKMDTSALRAMVMQRIEEEDRIAREQAKEERRRQREAERAAGSGMNDIVSSPFDQQGGDFTAGQNGGKGDNWYFYNLTTVAQGRSEFKSRWGQRQLEDNWRRLSKEKDISSAPAAQEPVTNLGTLEPEEGAEGASASAGKKKDSKEVSPEEDRAARIAKYMSEVPADPAKLEASNKKIRDALLKLGKIYDQKLNEDQDAINTFERLVNEFPEYEKRPEALYNLCLLLRETNQTEKYNKYRNILITKYPKTVFAKLIDNPRYLIENKARNNKISPLYGQAYKYYRSGRFVESGQVLKSIKANYPESDYDDNVDLLAALVTGRTLDVQTYIDTLNSFIGRYPKSDLNPYANTLLSIARQFLANNKNKAVIIDSNAVTKPSPYLETGLAGKQYFVALFPMGVNTTEIKNGFSDFNGKFYDSYHFTTTDMLLDNNTFMIRVIEFPSKTFAQIYLRKIAEDRLSPINKLNLTDYTILLTTPENFKMLYRLKDVQQYQAFFNKHYEVPANRQ